MIRLFFFFCITFLPVGRQIFNIISAYNCGIDILNCPLQQFDVRNNQITFTAKETLPLLLLTHLNSNDAGSVYNRLGTTGLIMREKPDNELLFCDYWLYLFKFCIGKLFRDDLFESLLCFEKIKVSDDLQKQLDVLTRINQLLMDLFIVGVIIFASFLIVLWRIKKSNKNKHLLDESVCSEIRKEKDMVQKELINSILLIEKKNKILKEIKSELLKLDQQELTIVPKKVFQLIDSGLFVDRDFEKFKKNFNTVYPVFFEKLQSKSNNSLTQLDLKYCTFILMRLSNKEIANQMNVEPESIHMARYRIKRKLLLAKDVDLDRFIHGLV
jgi:hypothetical protein